MTVLGMLASGWHSDRIGGRFAHLIGSMVLVAAAFAIMAFASTPAMLITAYLAMSFFWPAVTLSTCLVLTEVVPSRMVAVAMAAVNTLSQLGAFVAPTLWGMSKDSTGSYHFGLTSCRWPSSPRPQSRSPSPAGQSQGSVDEAGGRPGLIRSRLRPARSRPRAAAPPDRRRSPAPTRHPPTGSRNLRRSARPW